MGEPKHSRNIRIPKDWQHEITAARGLSAESVFMRAAIREKLDRVQTAKEMREIEERQAATLAWIVDTLQRLDRAVQTHLALQDAINQAILTHLPEPANMQAAREIGQQRYANVVEHAAREIAGNGNGKADGHA
jgi:hypothetical protein